MGSRWFEVNWISALWDRRQGSDTADIILLAIREVMLRTLKSLKRSSYSQTLGTFLKVSAHLTPQLGVCKGTLWTHHVAPARMEKNQVQFCLPWKTQISWAGEKGDNSLLLACSWSFSRHYFSISFQGHGTTLAVFTDVVKVAPCGQQDVLPCKNGLHMLAAKWEQSSPP